LSCFYALWIGAYPLFTPDEGRYSEVAREMVVTHNYLTPNLNGVAFLDKPILYYWLQASAIKLFGLKEWAMRLWPALLGILGCIILYINGRILFNRRTGLLGAFILATSPLYFGGAHYANLDLEVAVFINSALLFFMTAICSKKRILLTLFLGYLCTSLAFLTKGLIGIVFPAMIIGLWTILLNRWDILPKLRLFRGFLLFLAIVAPWYSLIQKANPQFFQYFFVTQQFLRFLTQADFNNQSMVWFYVPIIGIGFAPWTLFLLSTLRDALKKCWRDRRHYATELFLLIWFFAIFIFFTIPKSKTIGYILPVFAPLALLVANFISCYWSELKRLKYIFISFIIFCMLMSGLTYFIPAGGMLDIPSNLLPSLRFTALNLFISSVCAAYFLYRKQYYPIVLIVFITSSLFLLTFIANANTINHKTTKPLALELKKILKPNDEVATYQKYFQDLPIYLEKRITIIADWHADYILHHDNWQREMWFGMPYKDTSSWLVDEPAFFQRWHRNKRIFVFMYTDYYPHFKMLAKTSYVIDQYNDLILVSNQP